VSVSSIQFFDATYVQLHIGYSLNRGSTEPTAASTSTGFAALLAAVSFGAAVKYPIVIGPVAVFPIAGVEYRLNLSYTDDKGNDLKAGLSGPRSALNELWLKGGVGMDVSFGGLFLRPIVLVGFMPLGIGGAATLSSTHPTGSLSLARGTLSVDLDILFGCRF
jgi:hypothetical protein